MRRGPSRGTTRRQIARAHGVLGVAELRNVGIIAALEAHRRSRRLLREIAYSSAVPSSITAGLAACSEAQVLAKVVGLQEQQNVGDSVMAAASQLIKRAMIQSGLEAIALSGVRHVLPALTGQGVIFTLHHVRPDCSRDYEPNAHLSVTPQFLERAIHASIECGLTPVHLDELPRLLDETPSSRKFVCFTLDDGHRDNVQFAAPVFRKNQVPYTIFATTGFVDRTRTMWWETAERLTRERSRCKFTSGAGTETLETGTPAQKTAAFERLVSFIDTMNEDEAVARIDQIARDNGIDPVAIVDELILDESELRELGKDPLARIGAHTVTHVNLRRVSTERLNWELQTSAKAIGAWTGQHPQAFAYPYGDSRAVGDREVDAATSAGFSVAVTTNPGVLSAKPKRLTRLDRVSLNGHFQKKRYVKALISGIPFRLM